MSDVPLMPQAGAANGLDADRVTGLAQVFVVLGDPTRLRLLAAVSRGERRVLELVSQLGLTQPTVSHHLGILRRAGLVVARPEGKNVFYSLAEPPPAPDTLRVSVGLMTITWSMPAPLSDAA
jgi:DNA-binding transcriptional ArsR family regulator